MNWDWSPWTFLSVGPVHHICDRRANKCAVAHPQFEFLQIQDAVRATKSLEGVFDSQNSAKSWKKARCRK